MKLKYDKNIGFFNEETKNDVFNNNNNNNKHNFI